MTKITMALVQQWTEVACYQILADTQLLITMSNNKWYNTEQDFYKAIINIVNYKAACSLECIVNWPEPTDEGARNKEDKQEKWNTKRRPWLVAHRMLHWRYEVRQCTDNIQQKQSNVCYNVHNTHDRIICVTVVTLLTMDTVNSVQFGFESLAFYHRN